MKCDRRASIRRCAALLALGFVSACVEMSGEDDASARGQGTEACGEWQDALCDYHQRCNPGDSLDCDEEIRSVACKSDERASSCARTLGDAACDQAVSDCDVSALIDPAPARAACERFIDGLCDFAERCGQLRDECIVSAELSLDCRTIDAVALRLETCLARLRAQSCLTTELPSSCDEALKDLV